MNRRHWLSVSKFPVLRMSQLWLVLPIGVLSGCGSSDSEASDVAGRGFAIETGELPSNPEDAPAELMYRDRLFIRADLYVEPEEELALKDADDDGPLGRLKLARQLKAHMLLRGVYYVQAELDLELVDRILDGPTPPDTEGNVPVEGSESLVGRNIYGSDDRIAMGSVWTSKTAMGFSEIGASSSLIDDTVALTCGHCLFQTTPETTQNWLCRDFTFGTCAGIGYPSWKFGIVSGTTGTTGWIIHTCFAAIVPQGWKDVTSTSTNAVRAKWDWGFLDFLCPSDLSGTSHFGTAIYSDSDLLNIQARVVGYPARFPCPTGSSGESTDCGTGTFRWTGGTAPYTGAVLYGSPDVSDFQAQTADNMGSTADTTGGDSGGPVLRHNGFGLYSVIGVHAQSTSTVNVHRRWNSSLYNFADANTAFP